MRRPPPLQTVEFADIVAALAGMLTGGRVQKTWTAALRPRVFYLRVRIPGTTVVLQVDLQPDTARLHLVDHAEPAPPAPPMWGAALRKYVEGATIVEVRHHAGDRVVSVDLAAPDLQSTLVLELTGRRTAALLLEPDGTIITLEQNGRDPQRDLRPGKVWVAPMPLAAAAAAPARPGWPGADDPMALMAYLQTLYAGHETTVETLRTDVRRRLQQQRRRLERLLAHHQADLSRADDAARLRRQVELLRGAFGAVAPKATFAAVTDWYDPAQPTLQIPLDPQLDLAGNIGRMAHQARRHDRGAELSLERIPATEALLADLDQKTADLDLIGSLPILMETIAGWEQTGLLPPPRRVASGRARAVPVERVPYRAYTSSDGLAILVGRTSADNDRLTFGVARGNDLWMHVEDWSGSHVIIRAPRKGDVPHRTIQEAALLAGHFSRGAAGGVVTVRYTPRKHVRKPPGAPPGRVSIAAAKSVDVRLDDPRLPRLLATVQSLA